jgi:hypothetical protein
VDRYRLVFRIHALKRMRQRNIDEEDIRHVVVTGEIIENYPSTSPFPCRLVMGWCRSRCLHVVVAHDIQAHEIIVITAYEPDPLEWESDLKRRKP